MNAASPLRRRTTAARTSLAESLPSLCPLQDAVEALATTGGIEARGAIFTRNEVVNFLLDLVGYTPDKKLYTLTLLEPSFGQGDFLLSAIERLLISWKNSASKKNAVKALTPCIRAVELHRDTFLKTQSEVLELLLNNGIKKSAALTLVNTWLINDDFLLTELPDGFDVVIGNPPYVRQELIPDILLAEYRNRYNTIYDRADLYIPFIERSLISLTKGGSLGFICADRWMKNRYGGPLRRLVSEQFHLKVYVDMVNTQAFHSDVIAYPAITVITRGKGKTTRISHQPSLDRQNLQTLSHALTAPKIIDGINVQSMDGVVCGAEPWILDSSDQLEVIRRLEAAYPLLEEAGCKVGIGVATGADKAFIGPMNELDVEESRKLPLVMTKDIEAGIVEWRGLGVINPFADEGGLVDLAKYPKLKRYLEARKEQIAGRHCAQKSPANWYRTIDKITPSIALKHKLLIPDIKGQAHIVYEDGLLYPHHNLYYITSDTWDLKALQAVLLSSVTKLFIATYSTKMHGGFLRFQAQYLRRLRLPQWGDVPHEIKNALTEAANSRDLTACNAATFALYNLNQEERWAIGGNGE